MLEKTLREQPSAEQLLKKMKKNDLGLFLMWSQIIAVWWIFIMSRGYCVVTCITYQHRKIIFHFVWASNWLVNFFPLKWPLLFIFPTVLWTAQGHFLVENSEASTINRNTGVFWGLLQCRYAATEILHRYYTVCQW